jgi:hypothetical protein
MRTYDSRPSGRFSFRRCNARNRLTNARHRTDGVPMLQDADPMRWRPYVPAKLPLQVVGPAKGPGDAMLKFIGEAIKSEAANGYPIHAMSSRFVPKRKRKAMR